ncbi:hypothetical protein QQS21_007130 [Conoideocrella luteorostrata]|uniref:Uncharacterized protein n=1 Tax=Conoideocrella luteorostrata TaxID=1105319 RepID=A0AAJ0FZR1_9HYPO|nr:hypothetical protein QQS21_007130 [Conoideocrella luteorostrata]
MAAMRFAADRKSRMLGANLWVVGVDVDGVGGWTGQPAERDRPGGSRNGAGNDPQQFRE